MTNTIGDLRDLKYEDAGLKAIKSLPTSLSTFADVDGITELNTEAVINGFKNDDYTAVLDRAMRSIAAGGYSNQLQTFMYGIDRYQKSIIAPNVDHVGLTFITRPRLNLQEVSLDQDRRFAPLKTPPTSIGHALRCYLDTSYSKTPAGADASRLIDKHNPWFTPLMNSLVGVSGYPDPVLQTTTTNTGFFSEDQTFAIGYDELNKTYDLSLTFKDPQHGPIATLFYYWILYMSNLTRGTQTAYIDDITYQRLNYTVSIYRFRLDPTRRFITGYSKATGCFPKSVPLGAMFNFGEGELVAQSVNKFTIPFVVNKVEYNDYAIIQDFNMLAKRYWKTINTYGDYLELGHSASTNFNGLPYISTTSEKVEQLSNDGKKIEIVNHPGGIPRMTFRIPNYRSQKIQEV